MLLYRTPTARAAVAAVFFLALTACEGTLGDAVISDEFLSTVSVQNGIYETGTRTFFRNDGTTETIDVVEVRGRVLPCRGDCERAVRDYLAREQESGDGY